MSKRELIELSNRRRTYVVRFVGAVIVLPQGVAFATLAGMPPEDGLYAAMVPAIIAGTISSSSLPACASLSGTPISAAPAKS